jgi:hypothetical protein
MTKIHFTRSFSSVVTASAAPATDSDSSPALTVGQYYQDMLYRGRKVFCPHFLELLPLTYFYLFSLLSVPFPSLCIFLYVLCRIT